MNHLSIVENKNKKSPSLDPLQQKFKQLQKQLETVQKKYKDTEILMDSHLTFHVNHIQPLERQACDLLRAQIKNIYKHAENKKMFGKQARRSIFSILSNLFQDLNSKSDTLSLDEELSIIFKEVEGISYNDILSEHKEEIQSIVEELFTSKGINIDLTDFDYGGSQEEILERLFRTMQDQNSFSDEEKPKSKKELEKEERAMQLENLQKKGINSLYKQLAKAFHPDLEIDPTQKAEKAVLMKQLTLAYEENDLQTLLLLEIQWLKKSNAEQIAPNPDQLNHYNKILQEQIEAVRKNTANIFMEPKYFTLQKYFRGALDQMETSMSKECKKMQKNISANKALAENLQGPQALGVLRNLIQKQERQTERDFYL